MWWVVRDLNPAPKYYEHKEQFLYCVLSCRSVKVSLSGAQVLRVWLNPYTEHFIAR
jgi:hypothetical protein